MVRAPHGYYYPKTGETIEVTSGIGKHRRTVVLDTGALNLASRLIPPSSNLKFCKHGEFWFLIFRKQNGGRRVLNVDPGSGNALLTEGLVEPLGGGASGVTRYVLSATGKRAVESLVPGTVSLI